MKKFLSAVALLLTISSAGPALAYTSCGEVHRTCVQRCKADNPADKACASDHCDPKLALCRSSGCWKEGRAYGGQEHCRLKK